MLIRDDPAIIKTTYKIASYTLVIVALSVQGLSWNRMLALYQK